MKQRFGFVKKHLLPLAYAAAVVLWLLWGLFCLIYDKAGGEAPLNAGDAQLYELVRQEDGSFLSTGQDPRMIFENLAQNVRTLRLQANFSRQPGEMALYYSRKEGAGFSPAKRVNAAPQNDGSYLYTLPPGGIHALRLDPGMYADNRIEINAITLNPAQPIATYFLPGLRALLALAFLPALACCAIYTIIEGVLALRRVAAKWRTKEAGMHE